MPFLAELILLLLLLVRLLQTQTESHCWPSMYSFCKCLGLKEWTWWNMVSDCSLAVAAYFWMVDGSSQVIISCLLAWAAAKVFSQVHYISLKVSQLRYLLEEKA